MKPLQMRKTADTAGEWIQDNNNAVAEGVVGRPCSIISGKYMGMVGVISSWSNQRCKVRFEDGQQTGRLKHDSVEV